ncbi:MAG: hypothetical protein E7D27_03525 [Clostridium celatum]|nr:hypothetical protein [Clostridium celatum]
MNNNNIPIYIYLDQNKWIELAKGLKNEEIKYKNLYSKIRSNVESGIWAFPLSIIHIAEAMKRKDKESREDLLNLMYTLSKGCSIADYLTVNDIEFNYWIRNGIVDYKEIQSQVIAHDLSKIIGLSIDTARIKINGNLEVSDDKIKYLKNFLINHSCDIEIFKYICELCSDLNEDEDFFYECFVEAREKFKSWVDEIKKLDNYKEKHVYPAYLIKIFFEQYGEILKRLSPEYRDKFKKMVCSNNKNKEKTINFIESLPGFNINNRLVYELLSNPYKVVHKHDFFDLAFLRVAIPYCDIVIGENYWIDRIKFYKLDKKFNTISETKLFKLEEL